MGDTSGGLWLNTTGMGSNSTPQLSLNSLAYQAPNCSASFDTAITVTFFDSCNGIQASLVNASISGSGNFSLISPSDKPRQIHPNDSILVHYTSGVSLSDTSTLHLRFHLGWKNFDTTLSLIASRTPHSNLTMSYSKLQFLPAYCKPLDSVIVFTFFDTCTNEEAKLLSAELSYTGAGAFLLVNPTLGVIHPNDSLIVRYDPQNAQSDTALLTLKFTLNGIERDTSILLIGGGKAPPERLQLAASFTQNNISAGKTTDLLITPNKMISGTGLQRIDFDLLYNGDLLTETNILTQITGASVAAGVPSPLTPLPGGERGIVSLPVSIRGSDLSLDPSKVIADITFSTTLTDTNVTDVSISNLKLNNGDPDFANCILSADTTATTFTLALVCGDSSIQQYLRTGTFRIISIRPNPASDEIEIALHCQTLQTVRVEIFNTLGESVMTVGKEIAVGENSIKLNMQSIASGIYVIRVSGASGVVSQSFVKER
ncbi:MAG TPA: T9SS type A sorting domain-containing protein [Candidatus Kapabacteria bacterium]|nr:T9SS type A sorting domain-containing protein [Candidatus Kapabacteria bacterium]